MSRRNESFHGDFDGPGGLADWKGKYDPSDFIIPAQDHQGHSEREWARVMPSVDRTISTIVGSRRFPFKTKGDLIRWCIVRGTKVLEKMEPMPGFVGRSEAIMDMLRDEIYMQEYTNMFQTLQRVVDGYVSMGESAQAKRLVAQTKAKILAMEEEFWRNKCLQMLAQKFSHLGGGSTGKVKFSQMKKTVEEVEG